MYRERISIIIALHRDSPSFRKCIDSCQGFHDQNYEILVVSDHTVDLPSTLKLILTGSNQDTPPGVKRDIGMKEATGDFLAFIDDDAYPAKDWVQSIREAFRDPTVAAVGGPGLTPPDSKWRERAGGAFYESMLGSGSQSYRFRQSSGRDVDDYPAYNFIVRRSAAQEVGGWGTKFYGGEDTAFCLALRRQGRRIVYDPDVAVYHVRRPIFRSHWKQVGNVGRHRGYFVKAYPETSRRVIYFLPMAGVVTIAALAFTAAFFPAARVTLAALLSLYIVLGWGVGLFEKHELSLTLILPVVAASTHVIYGLEFLRGLMTRELHR